MLKTAKDAKRLLDGIYIDDANGSSALFRSVNTPTSVALTQLVYKIARCVAGFLEHQGLLKRDAENSYRKAIH